MNTQFLNALKLASLSKAQMQPDLHSDPYYQVRLKLNYPSKGLTENETQKNANAKKSRWSLKAGIVETVVSPNKTELP